MWSERGGRPRRRPTLDFPRRHPEISLTNRLVYPSSFNGPPFRAPAQTRASALGPADSRCQTPETERIMYTFACNTYKDLPQLALHLAQLRRCYPTERILVVSDGDDDPRLPDVAAEHSAEFIAGERLYSLECGGAIVDRLLQIFLDGPGDVLVKFDTDTRFFRPFSVAPPGDASGCIWGAYGFRYLQGGCRLLTRTCVARAVTSGLLSGPRYRNLSTWCPPVAEAYYRTNGKVSEDFITRDLLIELDIDIHDHPEVFSVGNVKRWRAMDTQTMKRLVNSDRRFAVTHPWKIADLKWAADFEPLLGSALNTVGKSVLDMEDIECQDTDTSLATP